MMDIWFKINMTMNILFMFAFVIDLAVNGESSGAISKVGGSILMILIFSWPAYWLSLLWA